MAFEGPIEDRLAIRELNELYGDAVRRHDASDWAKLWAEDAVWAIRDRDITGREAIVAQWRTAMAGYKYVSFSSQPGAISVSGDHAAARINTIEFLEPVDGPKRWQFGRYDDTLVRKQGVWLYARRQFTLQNVA